MANIKKVLKIQNQKFRKIRKEGDVIIVEADDPVFASSAINTLFGIKGVAIAKRVNNNFESIVNGVSKAAADIFLIGERFLLQILFQNRKVSNIQFFQCLSAILP